MYTVLLNACFPVIATIIGASVVLLYKTPSPVVRGFLQHLAAGVVFSVVSVELLPDIIKRHAPIYVVLGFGVGVLAMLWIKSLAKTLEAKENKKSGFPTAMVTAVAVDVLLDGFLIGIGFAAGAKEGQLLTTALTIELLSLGLAIAIELSEYGLSKATVMKTVAGISSLILLGTVIGVFVLAKAPDVLMETVLSFGLAALLFLVTEELLLEAHEQPETPATTAAFFLGFLTLLVVGMLA
ncbi:MAG: transporter [Candidatus Melainabacteria bacterium]|jgi:ZIP family zinc transporter|nr:MAG: transporter [Candidatus Melainabacteria bacterium]